MKKVASILAIGLLTSLTYAQDVTNIKGWIEDGIAHKPGTSSADVKKSISGGANYVFVDDASKQVWKIDNPDAVKGHEGHHISFTGGMDKTSMTVHIGKITMLKDQTPGPNSEAVGHSPLPN